jgi:hypothetical protein
LSEQTLLMASVGDFGIQLMCSPSARPSQDAPINERLIAVNLNHDIHPHDVS